MLFNRADSEMALNRDNDLMSLSVDGKIEGETNDEAQCYSSHWTDESMNQTISMCSVLGPIDLRIQYQAPETVSLVVIRGAGASLLSGIFLTNFALALTPN